MNLQTPLFIAVDDDDRAAGATFSITENNLLELSYVGPNREGNHTSIRFRFTLEEAHAIETWLKSVLGKAG
jgi:hypothetical protein